MNAITIAHLSDIHHSPREESEISTLLKEKGLIVDKLLTKCLDNLKRRNLDIVLITGDMTHDGNADDYRYLHDRITSVLPGVPILCSMGNHDDRAAFRQGFLGESPSDGPYYSCLSVKGFRFVSLDSAYEKGLEGIFRDDALDYLEEALIKPAARGTILVMHHPVMAAAKSMGLTMDTRLARILKSGNITALFNGHVHGCYTGTVYGVPQFTADSLKTGCDYFDSCLSYNDRAGYQIVTFDKKGDWSTERFLLHPETEIFFEKILK